jgi:hypothetical protein
MIKEDNAHPIAKEGSNNKTTTKFYIRKLNWIDIIPGYITPRIAATLSECEKEQLLKTFERPKLPLPDLPPLARIRLFKQEILKAESIQKFDYCIQDTRPIPDIKEEWRLEIYIQDKKREWHTLGGAERAREGKGKQFFLNLWANLETIDLTQSEEFTYLERKAGRIQYEFRTKLSSNKSGYLTSYRVNSSGYNQGPFSREFHRKQVAKELPLLKGIPAIENEQYQPKNHQKQSC